MADNSSLSKRIVTSALILALVGLVTFLCPGWAFALLTSCLIGIGLYEFFTVIERKGIFVYKYFGIILGMLIPVIIFLQMGSEGYVGLEPFFIVIACLFTFILQFARREISQAVTSIAVTLFGILYIAWFLSFFIKIRLLPHGTLYVVFLILVTKMGDVGAYLAGNYFGRRGLIPRISPHKTVEGTIGGLALSVLTAIACKSYLPQISYAHLTALGGLLAVLAQTGDLAESLIKRDCQVKDSGRSLSGFGGVLDLIDSLLFTAPIFYFYLQVIIR